MECLDSGMGADVSFNHRWKALASGSGGTCAWQFLGLKRGTWSGFGTESRVRAVVSLERWSTQVWLWSLPSPLLRSETWERGHASAPRPALTPGARAASARASVTSGVGLCAWVALPWTLCWEGSRPGVQLSRKRAEAASTWRRAAVVPLRDAGAHRVKTKAKLDQKGEELDPEAQRAGYLHIVL